MDTIHYEIDMLEYSFSKLTGLKRDLPELNMAVELFVLHYRNLIEFFSGKKHRDISVVDSEVWSGRKLTAEELIMAIITLANQ